MYSAQEPITNFRPFCVVEGQRVGYSSIRPEVDVSATTNQCPMAVDLSIKCTKSMDVLPTLPYAKLPSQLRVTQHTSKSLAYCTPNPVPNLPENNHVHLLDYRGAQLAAFTVGGRELVCLPQAFELFLKHLVGGLHTVYTKLKRLEIIPVVCNVEQVRILRGLGAIQPGVNRCKLIAPQEFDILYADCTNSSARPGRPSKRLTTTSSPSAAGTACYAHEPPNKTLRLSLPSESTDAERWALPSPLYTAYKSSRFQSLPLPSSIMSPGILERFLINDFPRFLNSPAGNISVGKMDDLTTETQDIANCTTSSIYVAPLCKTSPHRNMYNRRNGQMDQSFPKVREQFVILKSGSSTGLNEKCGHEDLYSLPTLCNSSKEKPLRTANHFAYSDDCQCATPTRLHNSGRCTPNEFQTARKLEVSLFSSASKLAGTDECAPSPDDMINRSTQPTITINVTGIEALKIEQNQARSSHDFGQPFPPFGMLKCGSPTGELKQRDWQAYFELVFSRLVQNYGNSASGPNEASYSTFPLPRHSASWEPVKQELPSISATPVPEGLVGLDLEPATLTTRLAAESKSNADRKENRTLDQRSGPTATTTDQDSSDSVLPKSDRLVPDESASGFHVSSFLSNATSTPTYHTWFQLMAKTFMQQYASYRSSDRPETVVNGISPSSSTNSSDSASIG